MNDEIKEIIEGIKGVIKLDGSLEFNTKELKILLDYITNLQEENDDLKQRLENEVATSLLRQQENEHLRTDIKTFSNTIIEVNKECNSLFNHLTKKDLNYKSRIDKAIDKLYCYGEVFDGKILQEFQKEMLNILNGGDE